MIKTVIHLVMMSLLLIVAQISSATLIENQDYVVLDKQSQTDNSSNDKIEVVEFFSYGCPYCEMIEPEISAWLKDKPANVTFTRLAIPRKGKWLTYTRFFYALEMISSAEQERILPLIYDTIHTQKINLDNEMDIFAWAKKQNVDLELLAKYFPSEQIDQQIEQALALAKSYQLQYIPAIYVNGKYQLILDSKNQYKGTKEQLNELIKVAEQDNQ